MAEEAGLDLVEIAPMAVPPVCKLMDFGKFKYQEQKKAHEARLKQKQVQVKEVKLRPGTDEVWGFDADHATIQALISDLAPEIGARILEHWHFAESLANIPTAAYDLGYNPGPVPTYADIVLVARLQNLASKGGDGMQADWADIPAFAKVGVEHEVVIIDMEGPAEEIAEVRSMLEG